MTKSLTRLNINILFFFITSASSHMSYGGETASTGIKKHRLHTERLPARKKGGNYKIIADDYNYALAA